MNKQAGFNQKCVSHSRTRVIVALGCSMLLSPHVAALDAGGVDFNATLSPRYLSFQSDSQSLNYGDIPIHKSLYAVRFDANLFASLSDSTSLSTSVFFINKSQGDPRSNDPKQTNTLAVAREFLWQLKSEGAAPQIEIGRKLLGNGVAKGRNPVDFFDTQSHYVAQDLDFLQYKMMNRVGQIGVGAEWFNNFGNLQIFYAPKLKNGDLTNAQSNEYESIYIRLTPELPGSSLHVDLFGFRSQSINQFGYAFTNQFYSDGIVYVEGALSDRRSLDIPTDSTAYEARHKITFGVETPISNHMQVVGEFSYNGNGLSSTERYAFYRGFEQPPSPAYFSSQNLRGQIGNLGQRYGFVSAEYATSQRSKTVSLNLLSNIDDGSSVTSILSRYPLSPRTTLYGIVKKYSGKKDSEFGLIAGYNLNIGFETRY